MGSLVWVAERPESGGRDERDETLEFAGLVLIDDGLRAADRDLDSALRHDAGPPELASYQALRAAVHKGLAHARPAAQEHVGLVVTHGQVRHLPLHDAQAGRDE